MDDIRNLDTVSDHKSSVLTDLPEGQVPRCPWHAPVLRRSDVTLYTGGPGAVNGDATGNFS
jgi:hypothetical protein